LLCMMLQTVVMHSIGQNRQKINWIDSSTGCSIKRRACI
jgi:hypothetical protein